MRQNYDIIVQGGGLTGLALAAVLAPTGARVALVEARPVETTLAAPFDGRVTAIARASVRLFEACGAWASMAARAEPIRHIEVAEAGGMASVQYDQGGGGNDSGPMGFIVENSVIRHALVACINKARNVELLAPFPVAQVRREPAFAEVTHADGHSLTAPLLALCEGRMSRTRETLGFSAGYSPYGQTGIVCTLAHEQPHGGRAIERFFPDGPFAVLPLPGNRSSIVWALADEAAEAVTALDDDDFAAEVAERFGDRLGDVRLEGPRWHYPLTLVVSNPAARDRVALVGDCLRGIHPIAGQGWNLALRDVAALAEIAVDALRIGLDPGSDSVLAQYERWRRFDGLTLVSVTDGINRLFSNDSGTLRLLRETGLAMVDQIPAAKGLFKAHAMGLLGDLPRLMRGEAL